ncbi:MAG TPA: 50S ribosomal protein L24e [Thermoplasmata archaeon]|nr:50S ribosomal protein L24e [Thermoplasmata archaeon]
MVERRVCTFCGQEIEPGTGRMYVKRDGVVYQFCTSKCFKNLVELKRVPRRTAWTEWSAREKQVRMKGTEPEPTSSRTRKVRKRATPKKEPATDKKPEPEEAGDAGAGPEEKSVADAEDEQGEKE